jgi:hypothetical protein
VLLIIRSGDVSVRSGGGCCFFVVGARGGDQGVLDVGGEFIAGARDVDWRLKRRYGGTSFRCGRTSCVRVKGLLGSEGITEMVVVGDS